MRGIWQILLGTIVTVWQFGQLGHGFWKTQTRFHNYSPNATIWTNTEAVVIYLACIALISLGVYRMLSAPTHRQATNPGAPNQPGVSSN
jgi:hypothetical protein